VGQSGRAGRAGEPEARTLEIPTIQKMKQKTFIGISAVAILCVPLLFVRWGSPAPYDISQTLLVADGIYSIQFPLSLDPVDVETGYYLDGGSVGASFKDNNGKKFMVWIDAGPRSKQRYKDVYLEEYSTMIPLRIADNQQLWKSVAYSLLLLDHGRQPIDTIFHIYPCAFDYAKIAWKNIFSKYFNDE
jgi:hypothetical protein